MYILLINLSFIIERKLAVKCLVNATKTVSNWYELGLQLDFEVAELNIIDNDHGRNSRKAKIVLFDDWLNNDASASWSKLAEALAKMGHNTLSHRLKKRKGMTKSCGVLDEVVLIL